MPRENMSEKELEKLLAGARGEWSAARELRTELGGLAGSLDQLGAELAKLGAASQTQTSAAESNTQALWKNTAEQTSGEGSSALASVGKGIWKWVGRGLAPQWRALIGWLTRDDEEEAPAAPALYQAPPAVRLEGEVSRTGGQEQYQWEWEQLWRGQARPSSGPQITVQVQALDSRSFLDHSEEIARAVREAMLNSHGLNDVVSEL